MDHNEAVQQMATERYLLDEMPAEMREAFEEHLFDCPECALDLRVGATFVNEAKAQLPKLTGSATATPETSKTRHGRKAWSSWWRPLFSTPAFAAPLFAALLLVVGYQNLVTLPALRTAANEPRLLPWTSLHGASRGESRATVTADRAQGAVVLVELPPQGGYSSYEFDLSEGDAGGGKSVWTRKIAASSPSISADGSTSVLIPGAGLHDGSYTLTVFGIAADSSRTELQRHPLDLRLNP